MKFILAISILMSYVCFCSRPFFSPDMCQRQEVNDCSFQFPYANPRECLIFNTKACESYDFSPWNLEPLTTLTSELDLPMNISIIPYASDPLKIHADSPKLNVSAINITMTVLHKDIKGLSFIMTNENLKKNICRIFDFRNYTDVLQDYLQLYYDCFHKLVEDGLENVTLTFQVYPQNIQAVYMVSIPHAPFKHYDSSCSWKPLIMIFQGGLQTYYIQLKFSNAPDNLSIIFYIVTLIDINDKHVKRITIPSNNGTDMISTKFMYVAEGYFSISISIDGADNTSCIVAQTQPFFVGHRTKDYSQITFIILMTGMCLLAFILLCIIFQQYHATVKPPFQTLLFVYSFDCDQHKEFLLAYIKFLEENYGVKIYSIYGNGGNPNAWIEEKYFEADIIVFVISEGLFHNFERNNIPPLVDDYWEGQVLVAGKFISEQKFVQTYSNDKNERTKKFCKICFPYSGKQHIPKYLKRKGNLFMLPSDEDKFLCFIFRCSKISPCIAHHKEKFLNDQHVKEKLEIMEETVSKNLHISYKENYSKINISETLKSIHDSDACEKKDHCSAKDFLKSVFEEKCKENIEISAQKSNFADLKNEDPVRYLIHKEFSQNNFES